MLRLSERVTMRSASRLRYWRSVISIWCTRGFCAEQPTITWCWWWREALPGITATLPSSSLWGKVTHVTVYFCSSLLTSRLNLTHRLAEYFLACLWVYRHSLSACCSIPTAGGDCHLLSTENGQQSAPQRHPTCHFGGAQPERSSCLISCPSLTVRVDLKTNHKGILASPLACPSFSLSLINSSGESHKISWSAEEQLNPFLVASFCKVPGSRTLETSQHISAPHPQCPFIPTHGYRPAVCKQISGISLLHDRDVQIALVL